MGVSTPRWEDLARPAFCASCGWLSSAHSALLVRIPTRLLSNCTVCPSFAWAAVDYSFLEGGHWIVHCCKDGPRHSRNCVALIWNTRQLGITVSVSGFTSDIYSLLSGYFLKTPERIYKQPCKQLGIHMHTEISHIPGLPSLWSNWGNLKEFIIFLSASTFHWCRGACFI